jgi:hypothetical protein
VTFAHYKSLKPAEPVSRIRSRVVFGFKWVSRSGSGSRQAKNVPQKKKEKKKSFMFEEFFLGLEASPGARRPFVGGF